MTNIYERRLSINDADEERSFFHNDKKREKDGSIPKGKKNLLKNFGFIFNEVEKVLHAFEGNIFSMKILGDDYREKISASSHHQPHLPYLKYHTGNQLKERESNINT